MTELKPKSGEGEERPVTVDFEGASAAGGSATPAGPEPALESPAARRVGIVAGIGRLVEAINRSDDAAVERAVLQLSRSRRWLAPLAMIVGAFLMLFQGLKLLITNWRLTLVQIVPAMWIWAAMLDIKIHVLHGKQFHVLRGPILIPAVLAVTGITAASFYLNGVFAFAISKPGKPQIRPAFGQANRHLRVILAWGSAIGLALSFSSLIATRWGHWPFAISQSIVVGIMMLCYLAVPARIVGIQKSKNTRDKLAATAVGGAVGAVVCSPPYLLGRFGILMLGWHYLFWLGVILIVIGATLQTAATSAVKAVKFSAKLVGNPSAVAAVGHRVVEPAAHARDSWSTQPTRVTRGRRVGGPPGPVATVEVPGRQPELVEQHGRRVASLADLAVHDVGTTAQRGEVLAQCVQGRVDAARDGAAAILVLRAHVEERPPLGHQPRQLVRLDHVALTGHQILRHVAEHVHRVLGR